MEPKLRLVTDQTENGWWAVYINDRIQIGEAFLDRRETEKLKKQIEDDLAACYA